MKMVWSARMRGHLLLVVVVALVATACGGDTDTDAGTESPSPVPRVIESTEDTLPEGFPDDVPLPDDYTVVYSAVADASIAVQFTSPLTEDDLRQLFIDELPVHAWVLVSCDDTEAEGHSATLMVAVKDDREAQIQVGFIPHRAQHLEEFQFMVVVNERPRTGPEQQPSDC